MASSDLLGNLRSGSGKSPTKWRSPTELFPHLMAGVCLQLRANLGTGSEEDEEEADGKSMADGLSSAGSVCTKPGQNVFLIVADKVNVITLSSLAFFPHE